MEIPYKIAVQSHLSDALFELETQNEELQIQALNRIRFVKSILLKCGGDLNKYTTDEELNQVWNKIVKPAAYTPDKEMTDKLEEYKKFIGGVPVEQLDERLAEMDAELSSPKLSAADQYYYTAKSAILYAAKEVLLQKNDYIFSQDVMDVAKRMDMPVSADQLNYVVSNYHSAVENDPSANWSQIVEQLLYESQPNKDEQAKELRQNGPLSLEQHALKAARLPYYLLNFDIPTQVEIQRIIKQDRLYDKLPIQELLYALSLYKNEIDFPTHLTQGMKEEERMDLYDQQIRESIVERIINTFSSKDIEELFRRAQFPHYIIEQVNEIKDSNTEKNDFKNIKFIDKVMEHVMWNIDKFLEVTEEFSKYLGDSEPMVFPTISGDIAEQALSLARNPLLASRFEEKELEHLERYIFYNNVYESLSDEDISSVSMLLAREVNYPTAISKDFAMKERESRFGNFIRYNVLERMFEKLDTYQLEDALANIGFRSSVIDRANKISDWKEDNAEVKDIKNEIIKSISPNIAARRAILMVFSQLGQNQQRGLSR